MHKLIDVPLDRLLVEHYLFDLDQSVEKTAEILDMDEETVRRIHQEGSGFHPTAERSIK